MRNLKIIAFDADDTLWGNEIYFDETEKKFCALMEDYLSHQGISSELFQVEMDDEGKVWYRLRAFSRPRYWMVRLAYPMARMRSSYWPGSILLAGKL